MFKWFLKALAKATHEQLAENNQVVMVGSDNTIGYPGQEWNVGIRIMKLENGHLVAMDEFPAQGVNHGFGVQVSAKSKRRQFFLADGMTDLTYELRLREAANGTLIEVKPVGPSTLKPLAWIVGVNESLPEGLAAAITAYKLQK